MKRKFNTIQFISQLLKFSPRQGKNERKTASFIISILKKYQINYSLQKFNAKIPLIQKAVLSVDGKKVKCKGCSFVSGKITNKDALVSSLIPSRFLLTYPNINFNPKCQSVSLDNFYFAPALAINKKDLPKILKAKKIKGEVKVKPYKYKSSNILVGNIKSPQMIIFAHYDSIEKGAIDNASGAAILMETIFSYPKALRKTLYVFIGNEELSYIQPTYWGYGFRVFEKKYKKLLDKAERILIIECVGNNKAIITQDKFLMNIIFPLKNLKKWENKIFILHGDIDKLMEVYHSNLDDLKQLKKKYLDDAAKLLKNQLK